jgi:mevalonate pyrophosphate decarboxylase
MHHSTCADADAVVACCCCRDFQEGSAEQELERQARLSRFSGAAAISSDAYFNRWGAYKGAAYVPTCDSLSFCV